MENSYVPHNTTDHDRNDRGSMQSSWSLTVSDESSLQAIRYIPLSKGTPIAVSDCQTPHSLHRDQQRQRQRHSLLDAYEDDEDVGAHVAGIKMSPLLREPHENDSPLPNLAGSIILSIAATANDSTTCAVRDTFGEAGATENSALLTTQRGGCHIRKLSHNGNSKEAQRVAWGPMPPSFYQGSLYWRSAALFKPIAHTFVSKCNSLNLPRTTATTSSSKMSDSNKKHAPDIVNAEWSNLTVSTNDPVAVGGAAKRRSSPWWCGEVEIESSEPSNMYFGGEDKTFPHTPTSRHDVNEPDRAVLPPPDPMNRHRMLEMLLQHDAATGGRWSCCNEDEALDGAEAMSGDETCAPDTQTAAAWSGPVNEPSFIRRSGGETSATPSSVRDRRLRYISGIVRLLLVPEALDLEERDVRRWIRSVNTLRRHARLWADETGNSSAASIEQLPHQTLQSREGINSGDVEDLRSGSPGRYSSLNPHNGMRQRQLQMDRVSGSSGSGGVGVQSSNSPVKFIEHRDVLHFQQSAQREDENEADGDGCNANKAGRAYSHVSLQGSNSSSLRGTPPVLTLDGQMDTNCNSLRMHNSSAVGDSVCFSTRNGSNGAVLDEHGQSPSWKNVNDHDLASANVYKRYDSRNQPASVTGSSCSCSRNNNDNVGGGGKSRNPITSGGDRLAIRIALLKAHLVLMNSFLPLPLFVGLSVFASAVAISGLFVVVLALLLGLVVYRHVVMLYTLCFSTGESGGWILLSFSLLNLTRRFGGPPLFLITSLLLVAVLLCAAVLFLSLGYVLTGGSFAMLRVLWNLSTLDKTPMETVMESTRGCEIDEGYRILLLLPFFLFAVCAAGPANARSYICWWETGLFRLVSIVQFAILFITTLYMQVRWTLEVSPSKFNLPLPFFHILSGDTNISSLHWLADDIFNAEFWNSNPAVAYILLHLSLSAAQLSWLFTCGLSAIRTGTYHLYLVPLLWRRTPKSMNVSGASERGGLGSQQQFKNQKREQDPQRNAKSEECGHETEKNNGIVHSLSGVFMASGFGGPFSCAFALFLAITLAALFAAFVGASMWMPSLTAPLPVRLLWTAVEKTTPTSSSEDNVPAALCALGILHGAHVGTSRFAAVLSFLTGLLFFAWVPYFIVHVSSMLANLRPGAEPGERQAHAASAFLRSRQAAAQRNAEASPHRRKRECHTGNTNPHGENGAADSNESIIFGRSTISDINSSGTFSADFELDKLPKENTTASSSVKNCFTRLFSLVRGAKTSTTAHKSVIFDLSSPFMSHPELYRATTRAGDGVRVIDLFKHLRLLTRDRNWVGYHVAEVLLLRVPFLLAVFMGTAVLVAGRRARCYTFWTFFTASTSSMSYICRNTSTPISDELYGRLVLFATVSGGLFVAPLVFAIPPFLLMRYWYEKRRCLSMNSRLTSLSYAPESPHTMSPQHSATDVIAVPLLTGNTTDHAKRIPPLSLQDARGGLAGVRFFLALQDSGEAATTAFRRSSGCGARRTSKGTRDKPFVTRTALLFERHRYATYGAPLPPSRYWREYAKKQRQCDTQVTLARWALDSLLRPLINAAMVVLSLLVVSLAFAGAVRAIFALFDKYGDSNKSNQWTL